MDFHLSEEHEMIRKMVQDFAEKEVAPSAAERDEEERFDRGIFERMAELGLTGIPWPEEYGGIGSDFLAYVIAVEELSRVCASTGVTLSAHLSLASWPIYKFGTEEQKQKYLKPLAQGKKIGAYCLTESGSGSDAGAMKTTAKKGGSLRIKRFEDFYHQRRRRRDLHRLRPDRSGAEAQGGQRLHRGEGFPRF
ncbi:Acyl-CoA dehydrogenase [Caldibacillus debilis GB1]|uniref:Acyl-CoA dehydrogenase n=1 Tax=Caldibacillus debilis GB1 TaxID=1339248 RepID=A0A420VGI5_9BACI|nr:Acyl-CoA dehydrogenase [Caldibacillus debilis GB1]